MNSSKGNRKNEQMASPMYPDDIKVGLVRKKEVNLEKRKLETLGTKMTVQMNLLRNLRQMISV